MVKKHSTDSSQSSLRMRVYEHITQEMDKGHYFPGSNIRLNELAEKMGVSKTPLREAMIRLESEGVVTIYPRQGVVVNKFDLKDCRYLFGVIGALEGDMVTDIFDMFTTNVVAQMRTHCANMRSALESDDFSEYDDAHWEFHQVFLTLADNVFVERIIKPIRHRLWDFPKRGFSKQWLAMACDEHDAIVDAIEAKQLQEAVSILREKHWSYEYNESFIRKVYFPQMP